jgi:hypothetical protein
MPTHTEPASPSTAALWAGAIITGLLVLFLVFDAAGKIFKLDPVVEGSQQLGIPPDTLLAVGLILLACTAIYSIPKTAVVGAILLTGYLGGATAIHVCAKSGAFPIAFSVGFGILTWVGLVLREPRLIWTILLRH